MSPDTTKEIRAAFATDAGGHLIGMSRALVADDLSSVSSHAGALRDGARAMGHFLVVEMTQALIDAADRGADREQIQQGVDALHETVPAIVKSQRLMAESLDKLTSADESGDKTAPEPIAPSAIPERLRSGKSEPLKAIVADDSATMRQVHADALSEAGFDVHTARDGSAALRQLENVAADVVVTDFDMAPMNGAGLIRAMHADTRFDKTPVIVVSGRAPDEVRQLIGDIDVAAIIPKEGLESVALVTAAETACDRTPRQAVASGRILVAEDSQILRVVLRDQLIAAGYEVIEAQDGEEALALATSSRPDVALLDREMPKLDGFGVLAALKANPETAELPVVFVTGRVTADELAEGLDRGAHDYVRKPVQPAELLARIRTALRLRSLHDELALRNEELEAMAQTDVLTGLTNRRQATNVINAAVGAASRYERDLSVIMLDIDRFKSVNDTYGHAGGDDVLRTVAEILRRTLRVEDTPARWGGEEFLVVLPEIAGSDAGIVAERVRSALEAEPIFCSGTLISVTASLGVAEWTKDEDAESLIARADDALYTAKDSGRNRVYAIA